MRELCVLITSKMIRKYESVGVYGMQICMRPGGLRLDLVVRTVERVLRMVFSV